MVNHRNTGEGVPTRAARRLDAMENDETNGSGTLDRSQEDAELRFADDEAVGVRKADAPACEDGTVAGAGAPGPLLPWLPWCSCFS